MKIQNGEIRRYSEALKKKVVEEVESGKLSQAEAARRYGLRRGAVWDFLRAYGRLYNKRRIVEVVMVDQKEKIDELKEALADAHLKLRLYDKMLELAGKEYKADLKKNFFTQASELLKNKGLKSDGSAE
jgi:transposase